MDPILNLLLFITLLSSILLVALFRFESTGISGKVRRANAAPWDLHEFLLLNPSKGKYNEYYRFNEETVRSHTHRFLGRFDTAILHWEKSPILDAMVERKFPVNNLPERVKEEDIFQAGLYTLALAESGVSCSETQLAIIYCLQDTAKRCLSKKSPINCWSCPEGKKFHRKYNEKIVRKQLKRLDEVWYNKRKPKPSPSPQTCGTCPYGRNGKCNYSEI